MNKIIAAIATVVALFNLYSPANSAIINNANNFFKSRVMVADIYMESLDRLPSFFEIVENKNGKDLAFDLLHSDEFKNKNLSEGDIVNIYYNIFLGKDATDWDKEFWSKRITKDDTTLLLYGLINSETFTNKCKENGLTAEEYFIESGVFTEGFSPISEECGLTDNGDYVFYATFGDATYYHVVNGAADVIMYENAI